ncbi:MAG: universal stress protein [Armatimonadota bacterium]
MTGDQVIVHVHPLGVFIALLFTGLMGSLLWWMLHPPPVIPLAVAHARRSVGALRSILVPTVGASHSDRGVELACRLGAEQKADVHLVYVIEVPRTLPLGAPLPEAEAQASRALEQAAEIVRMRGLNPVLHIERAREAAEGIIRAARDHQADVIVLGMRPDIGPTEALLGRTTDALLRRAPCEVIVDKVPSGSAA